MQLYALSTGSLIAGAFSMFLFSMGTVPLMFGVGALSAFLSSGERGQGFARRVTRAGAILVTVMGLLMTGYGLNLSGLSLDFARNAFAAERTPASRAWRSDGGAEAQLPEVEDGVQVVNSTLRGGRYPAIVVRQGLPVRWTIDAPAGSVNGCNNRMIIREYGIEYRFKAGANVIEFMPERTGRFTYSCWMGMIRSTITVVAEGEEVPVIAEAEGDIDPSPAGVVIQAEKVLKAEMAGNGAYQTAAINLRDDGLDPAVIVFQRGLPAAWTINNDSLDPGNSRLVFPAYYAQIDMGPGDNVIELLPTADFDFSTADNVFYGFVKVVDDLNAVDIEAVRTEASDYETLIYPDAYFEAGAGGGCCAR
jgi:plastocyanin domain-containing protein